MAQEHRNDFPLFQFPMLWYDTTNSTNEAAKTLSIPDDSKIYVICSGFQHQGKGQHGKTWESPQNSSILATFLFPESFQPEPLIIKWVTSGSVALFLEGLGISGIEIKAPNDILVKSRKISGVLTETVFKGDLLDRVICGAGINVSQKVFDPAIPYRCDPTSIHLELEAYPDMNQLFYEWCRVIHGLFSNLLADNPSGAVLPFTRFMTAPHLEACLGELMSCKKTSKPHQKMIDELHKLRYLS